MKRLSYILFLIPAIILSGYSFSQQVISTAGGSASGTGIELSWTIGEPVTATAHGSDFYLTQGFHQSQIVTTIFNQELSFFAGWNIMSLRVLPENKDLLNIFQPLIDAGTLKKVMDESGNSLEDWGIFGGWQNNIGDINLARGYKVKVNGNTNLVVSGSPVLLPYAIPLQNGWNIMGYPNQVSYDAMKIVQPLINHGILVKVQDEGGNSIEDWGIFGGWTNNIGNLISGKGYKIRLNANDTLWINESYPKSFTVVPELVATNHFIPQFEGNGVDHMNINLVGLPVNILITGDELAIFDGTTCVGAVKIMPQHLRKKSVSVAASANDDSGMAGFNEGNPITLKHWNSRNNQEFTLEPEIISGTFSFTKFETTFVSLEKYATTGLEGIPNSTHTEINCYPNPFSDELNIEINLAEESEVQVEILNQLGQKVKILTAQKPFAGGTHLLIWNGRNSSNSEVSPGIYYLRIFVNSEIYFKKVVYSKTE